MKQQCEICARTPFDCALYRVNPTGVLGIWHCWDCLTPEQKAATDPHCKEIVDIIEADNKRQEEKKV